MMAFIYLCLTVLIFCAPGVRTGPNSGANFICGEELSAVPGILKTLTSPNFIQDLQNYPPDTNCTWIVRSVAPWNVVIKFEFFAVERDFNCDSWDWVTIDNGEFIGQGDLGRFCGDNFCSGNQPGFYPTGEIVSDGSVVTINFCSDFLIERPGFLLTYTSTN